MNELKPEDVMRALEWCSDLRLCVDCPMRAEGYFSHSGNACRQALMKSALALLREKDAEIERLKKHLDYKCIYGYDGDVMEYCVQGPCPYYKRESEVRAEAIDEFADGCVEMAIGIGNIPVVCLESILKFAEKMKGEIYGNKQGKTSKP